MKITSDKGFAHLLLVAVLAVVIAGGTATVAAADGAKPGDTLYSVDRGAESVRGAFAFGDKAKADFRLKQANERLEELQALQTEGATPQLIGEASEIYGEAISEAANALATAAQSGEGFDEAQAILIAQATGVHLDVLAKVLEQVPEQAKAAVEGAIEKSEQGAEKALDALNGQLNEEQRQQAEDKIEESKQRRGAPADVPNGDDASGNGAGNTPADTGRP